MPHWDSNANTLSGSHSLSLLYYYKYITSNTISKLFMHQTLQCHVSWRKISFKCLPAVFTVDDNIIWLIVLILNIIYTVIGTSHWWSFIQTYKDKLKHWYIDTLMIHFFLSQYPPVLQEEDWKYLHLF